MAASSSHSTSSSSNSMGGWTYDVFLSFRGLDTRKHFLDHLYTALDNAGIYTYEDDKRLLTGEPISEQISKAIEESRFAVVVFSENYADSGWCLNELAHINHCRKKIGQTVIPVFYNVNPYVVRRQLDSFGKAFHKHEKRNESERIEKWKDALFEIAGLSGFDVSNTANGHESECIKKIVQYISNNCRPISNCQGNLVGMNSRVQDLKSLLATELDVVRFVGIWGIGGAGKTTLAWAVYSEISYQFEGRRCFVENVKELSKQYSGLEKLQEKILSEILMDKSLKISSLREGIGLMGSRLRCKKVLLVLDDVDDDAQLDALAAHHEWFGKGSRIIITTRDQRWLTRPTSIEKYNASLLNDAEAIKLFSLYAFGKDSPPAEYKVDLSNLVRRAGGFPLALKVLGASLYDCTVDEWKSALSRLDVEGEDEVSKMLKVSYDGLSNIDQKILLDIACFFKGKKIDLVTRILDSFEFHAHIGIKHLVQRSLIFISKSRIHMHDRIQEMAWRIVGKSSDNPGERSRLCLYEDVCQALTMNRGMDAVEGISLNSSDTNGIMFDFKNMDKLRLLVLGWCKNSHSLTGFEFLSNLRWLTWDGCNSDTLPEVLWTAKLVGLELRFSKIVQLWGEDEVPKGKKSLDKLRFIDLNRSDRLQRTPDLNLTPNLHTLILEGCFELEEVHPSIGDHQQLVFLSLKGCKKLRSLPSSIGLKSLETLILSECEVLRNFPDIKGNMKTLAKLYLARTAIEELPASIGTLSGLVLMDLRWCIELTSLPSTICELKCLKTLYTHGCRRITKFPEKLGEIQGLEDLQLDGCSAWVHSILSTLSPHSSRFCLEQPAVLQSFHSIRKLSLSNCNLSNRDIPADLSCFSSLEELNLSRNNFTYLPQGFCQLPLLKILDVSYCIDFDALKVLPSGIAVLNALLTAPLSSFPDLSTKYDSLWNISYAYSPRPGGQQPIINCILKSLLQGQLVANHRFSILVMGDCIPEWFGEKSPVDDPYMELPLNWYKDDILGFAITTVPNLYDSYMYIQFDLIEESKQRRFRQTSIIHKKYYFGHNRVWMGFISFKFFELLFHEYQPDYWSTFMGTVGVSISKEPFTNKQLAIRAVYKEDVERVPTSRISEQVQNDPTGQPWLHPYLNKEDMGYDEIPSSLTTGYLKDAYLKERGSTHAKLVFPPVGPCGIPKLSTTN